jgi:hypothetical protein
MNDTSINASAIQTEIHRQLSGGDRLLLALDMSFLVRELSITRLRREHPDWSDSRLKREVLRYSFLSTSLPEPLI